MTQMRPKSTASQKSLRLVMTACVLLLSLCFAPAAFAKKSVAQKKKLALTQYATAQKMREAITGKSAETRKRADFTRVIDAFRKVYYIAPTSNKADESALAVAEMMAEYGRAFDEEKSFRDAIAQFEFLRREYPGSKYRYEALFAIGQIYREDLGDTAKAKSTFDDFLNKYPGNELAEQARDALKEMEAEAKSAKSSKNSKKVVAAKKPKPDPEPASAKGRVERVAADDQPVDPPSRTGRMPQLTSIRHWSTPDYTRIAIDLEDEVKYEAGRVPSPDRIYFDLHNTKLASELKGKSFEVGEGLLRKIRVAQFSATLTRVVLEVDDVAEYSAFLLPNPYRLVIDIHGKQTEKTVIAKDVEPTPAKSVPPAVVENPKPLVATSKAPAKDSADAASPPEATKDSTKELTEVASLNNKDLDDKKVKSTSQPTSAPTFESVSPRKDAKKGKKPKDEGPTTRTAQPTANGERSLIRALGLKIGRIVVDAGHGGHDTGTVGPNGLMEKDLVLDVALRLGSLLESKLGAEVIYTRSDDTFIPLETRTAMANQHQADLFISVHANSSDDSSARGVETYYLNFTSNEEALEVAARENAVSQKSVFELQDLIKKIALKEKIEESREFATNVQKALYTGLSSKTLTMRDRGVKKAPFVVLIGANMPSILAEISFVSNPSEEKKLKVGDYRQKIADSLFKGISRYAAGLSGVKVASNAPENSAP